MNVRVSLIILAAAIFMAVWDADQKLMHRDRVALAQARAAQVAQVESAKVAITNDSAATSPAPVATSSVVTTSTSSIDAASDCIPVPARLAPGTWEVTDERGGKSRITIHATQAVHSEHSFCIITTEQGRRWCFVRVPDIRSAETGADSLTR